MKNKTIILWVLVPFLLLLTNCKNDDDIMPNGPIIEEPIMIDQGERVTTSITGFIVDENNTPVENAEIRSGTNMVLTDSYGFYNLENISTNSKDTYITIQRDGYIHNSRRIYPTDQSKFTLNFKLLQQNTDGIMLAGEAKEVSLPNGAKLMLPANSVSYADGRAYDGDVHISLDHLSPDADDLFLTMPGDLTGIGVDGNLKVLASYGMLSVVLSSDTGESLQLSSNMSAELSFPVPSNLVGNAPSTIPLWHFDETEGRWKEEGAATLQGNIYVGSVSHFSFWNCDAPFDIVFVSGNVSTVDGIAAQNVYVKVTVNSSGLMGGGYTDEEGNFGGFMPKDESLNFKLISNLCVESEEVLDQTFGPFSTDTDLGVITVELSETEILQINGSLLNCDGELVENGYVRLNFNGNQIFEFSSTGEFNLTYLVCEFEQITIEGIDLETGKTSDPLSFSNTSPIQTGPITVCEDGSSSCLLSDDDFSGLYFLSYIGDASAGFGIPFPEGGVEINPVNGSFTKRYFNLPWAPGLGGFDVSNFVFEFLCDEVIVPDFNTGLACAGGSISIVQGDPSPIDLTNDDEIILNIIEYQDDGGCGVAPSPKTIKLIKQ